MQGADRAKTLGSPLSPPAACKAARAVLG
jgi:hypothetical protein